MPLGVEMCTAVLYEETGDVMTLLGVKKCTAISLVAADESPCPAPKRVRTEFRI